MGNSEFANQYKVYKIQEIHMKLSGDPWSRLGHGRHPGGGADGLQIDHPCGGSKAMVYERFESYAILRYFMYLPVMFAPLIIHGYFF